METQHIRFVRSVAKHGSISAAAREHGMTQSALTKIVSRAEDLVGARLFDRKSRGVELTPFGQLFLDRMIKVEQEMLNLSQDIQAMKAGEGGTVSVGIGQFWIGRIVPNVIARLTNDSSDVRVQITTGARSELFQRLQNGDIDLLLGRITDELPTGNWEEAREYDLPDGLSGEPLAEVQLHLTVREEHPLTKLERPVTPEDLKPYGWALAPSSDPTTNHIKDTFSRLGISMKPPTIEAVSYNLIVGLVHSTDLITVLPKIIHDRYAEGLVRLDANWLSWSRYAGVIRVKERTLLPCCHRFLGFLREETRSSSA